jgi:hypothetical protein
MALLRQATANGRRSAWVLKLDVASFFPSIHKETLYELLVTRVRHPELRWPGIASQRAEVDGRALLSDAGAPTGAEPHPRVLPLFPWKTSAGAVASACASHARTHIKRSTSVRSHRPAASYPLSTRCVRKCRGRGHASYAVAAAKKSTTG